MPQTTQTTQTERRISLTDAERSEIRWSQSKRGYIVRLTFEKHWTRRGPRDVRPLRSKAFTVEGAAHRHAAEMIERPYYVNHRYPIAVADCEIVVVDSLGNVI